MRRLSRIFYVMAGLGAALWMALYVMLAPLTCAFGTPDNGSCTTPMPWQLSGDDLSYLVQYPLVAILGTAGIGYILARLSD